MFNKLIKKEAEKARAEIEAKQKLLQLLEELHYAEKDVVTIALLTTEEYLEGR